MSTADLLALADLYVDTGAGLIGVDADGTRRIIKCADVLAALRASAAPGGEIDQRVTVARIIDPRCFWDDDPPNDHQQRKCDRALAKADAILAALRPSPAPAETERGGDALPTEQVDAADIRWGVNVLLETIAKKFEDWDTHDIWRSDAASTVRSYKHDAATLPERGDVRAATP